MGTTVTLQRFDQNTIKEYQTSTLYRVQHIIQTTAM